MSGTRVIKGVPPDMSRDEFVADLVQARSPAAAAAGAVYDYCVKRTFLPSALLGFFNEESSKGTNPAAIAVTVPTYSWGNTTEPSYGDPGLGPPFVRGRFTRYKGWYEGGVGTVARFFDKPEYVKAYTVRQIVTIWAPPNDNNRTEDYIAGVDAEIVRLGKGRAMAASLFADSQQWIEEGDNRPQMPLKGFHSCTAHETDNEAPGADAIMHHNWLEGNPRPDASFHLCADAFRSIELLPIAPGVAEVGYHIGDGADQADDEAFFTIAGEICVNSRSGFPAACRRMAKAFARVLKAYNRPVIDGVTVRTHGSYWSTRNPKVHRGCPKHLMAGDWGVTWAQFIQMCRDELAALGGSSGVVIAPPPPAITPPVGYLPPGTPDTFQWQDGAGVIVKRSVRYYNPFKGVYYDNTWDHETGYSGFVEVKP